MGKATVWPSKYLLVDYYSYDPLEAPLPAAPRVLTNVLRFDTQLLAHTCCRYFERHVPFFAALRPAAVHVLAANATVRDVPAGFPVCLQDGMADSLLLILSGCAYVYRKKTTVAHHATPLIQATTNSIDHAAGDECAVHLAAARHVDMGTSNIAWPAHTC